ncbi:MAG: YdiU family protein [Methylophaga sp.]|nr:YdiU family protein [Methylophaga sp.]
MTNLIFNFDNHFINCLPADPIIENTRRQVVDACYSFVDPTKVKAPILVAYSAEVAQLLELSEQDCQSELFTQVFAGNKLLDGMKPYAQCYGGHQFGNWAGQLGDGRAINLGEVVNQQGQHHTLQLKGAGPTPYSRTADGLAVLRSSVREFLCSEAMFHLGVPTTRALSLVTTGENVVRDMFYDGRPKEEPGAIVCRVAPSFLRFGSYEIFSSRGDIETLRKLVDFTIRTDFPHLGKPSIEVYLKWFSEVCEHTADMIVHWMRVGFVHGVMNTDNMSILGLTIDYGPYGWLEDYDPNWTPNTTDASGRRYRFGNQAQIAQWNLFQLANAIYPLIEQAEPLREILSDYAMSYEQKWQSMRASKLGLTKHIAESDPQLHQSLHEILQLTETDMTIFYRRLANVTCESLDLSDDELITPLLDAYYDADSLTVDTKTAICDWLRQYQLRVQQDGINDETRRQNMNQVNPKYVLRNYLAQLAIDKAEQNDFSMVNELLELFRHPYDEQKDMEHYAVKRPDWARDRAGCSMLSCSS